VISGEEGKGVPKNLSKRKTGISDLKRGEKRKGVAKRPARLFREKKGSI